MNNYQIEVSRQGKHLTFLSATAKDPLVAISQIERRLNLSAKTMRIGDGKETQTVNWTGYEFTARRV